MSGRGMRERWGWVKGESRGEMGVWSMFQSTLYCGDLQTKNPLPWSPTVREEEETGEEKEQIVRQVVPSWELENGSCAGCTWLHASPQSLAGAARTGFQSPFSTLPRALFSEQPAQLWPTARNERRQVPNTTEDEGSQGTEISEKVHGELNIKDKIAIC